MPWMPTDLPHNKNSGMTRTPRELDQAEACVDAALAAVGPDVVLAAPLGIGKPIPLVNAFYRRAEQDPSISLTIITALSLERPKAKSDFEARLLEPFFERQFGTYEEPDYIRAEREDRVPDNIRIHEFYFRAGSMKRVPHAQRHYISTNYSFVARDAIDRGVNVLVQLVSEKTVDGKNMLSLSSNTDVTLDLLPMLAAKRASGEAVFTIAQVHDELPFMFRKAMVEPSTFDALLRNPKYNTTLFAPPNPPVSAIFAAIGFHVSSLIRDGGTLQIGIGSLGDAIVQACLVRHTDNAAYRHIAHDLGVDEELANRIGGLDRFDEGLFGSSEMFVNGFLHLLKAGILKRQVFDDTTLQRLLNRGQLSTCVDHQTLPALRDAGVIGRYLSPGDLEFLTRWGVLRADVQLQDGSLRIGDQRLSPDLDDPETRTALESGALGDRLRHGYVMHGGFFLGPNDFYQTLRSMTRQECEQIVMDGVRQINRLDAPELRRLQRLHARFINSAMMVTLGGAVISDGLENDQVISGVGGQYDFVAQAHELEGARSIICLRSTFGAGKSLRSNIVDSYGHATIPRHLKDIVVTEYGVADLRGKSDEEVSIALLGIADSRFQDALLESRKAAGKLRADFQLPQVFRNNTPERLRNNITEWRDKGVLPRFPFGTALTDEEVALADSLRDLKARTEHPLDLLRMLFRAITHDVDEEQAKPWLERLQLAHPDSPKELVLQQLLLQELEDRGYLRPM